MMQSKDLRVDAVEKLRGQSRYISDDPIDGLWYAGTIRSPHPRARIKSISFDPALDWDAVSVVTAQDVPNNYVAMLENDMPFLAASIVNYVGEPVALVAAADKTILARAMRGVIVEYEPLPFISDMQTAETSDIVIFPEHNVFKEIRIENGDPDGLDTSSLRKIEIETQTGFQEHLYLEPQGVVAIPEADRIVIRGSMQCPYYIKNAVEVMFDGKRHVTVIQAATGGAFGGKEDYPSLIAGHVALLAAESGHPVGLFFDRFEDVQYTTKRHPSYVHQTVWVDENGKIHRLDIELLLDGGAYCTLSQVVLARAALTATNCYYVPNVRIHAKAVATNTVPSGAFRGFGGPQAVFAMEMLIEKIAFVLQLPAEHVRSVNLIGEGQETPTGQRLTYSVSARQTFDDVLRRSDYVAKRKQYQASNTAILQQLENGRFPQTDKTDVLRGIGISTSVHGAGFTGTGENIIKGVLKASVETDGRVVIYSAQTEMGQGQQTVFRTMLADSLHIDPADVMLSDVNTDLVPNSGPTVASRSTMVVGSLLVEAAKEIIARLAGALQKKYGVSFRYENGLFVNGNHRMPFRDAAKQCAPFLVEKQYHHPPFIRFDDQHWRGDAYPVYSWAAAVAEVEVDPITFEIRVTHYYTTHDIGKAINHDQATAQIQGGSLQGIGYALYEKISRQKGHFDITGFADYIIPGPSDMPDFHVHIMENPYPYGPFGAKGLGELPFVGAAPAVVSALWMIFHKEFNRIPVMPEDLVRLFP